MYRKTTPRDGTAPLLQIGYGSYGSTYDPEFSYLPPSLLDRGFVVAIAHIRGGQEMGRAWYENGKLLNKKNTFTDFIDVTRWLAANKYSDPKRAFALGRSAGGLLMGAIANMAPQDYRGIVAGVPFVDVVTTMLDETIPLTTNEFDEWGNPKKKEFYDYMLSYSPYDNLGAQTTPRCSCTRGCGTARCSTSSPPSTSRACARAARATASWCCAPTWRPATAASRGATSITASTRNNMRSSWTKQASRINGDTPHFLAKGAAPRS